MRSKSLPSLFSLLSASVAFLTACSSRDAGADDKPLEVHRVRLLDLAFNAVTRMPLDPHIKDRSLLQEAVVTTCLELGQPRRALRYIQEIANWRQGAAYADLAFYCAEHGHLADVQQYLDLACQLADRTAKEEHSQAWRRDRVRAKIAQTYALLGEDQKAAQFVVGAEDSEPGRVEAVRARVSDNSALDGHIKAMEAALQSSSFEQIRFALKAGAVLFDRVYEDADRRHRIEQSIRTASVELPVDVRIEVLSRMAGLALDHRDRQKALELVKEARVIMDSARWLPENQIPLMARLAALRYRAGEREEGRRELDAARALFDARWESIVGISLADVLCPIAEAYHAMGDGAAALKVYRRAVEEGVKNPNSRPRAEGLAKTCCSIALRGIEPGADLERRLVEVGNGLGDPW